MPMPMAMSADASNRAPAERVSGETIQHLGRQYRPKLHKSAADAVKLIGRFLHVWTKKPLARIHILALVEGWYREHAA